MAGEPIFDHPTTRPTEIAYLALDRSWQRYQELFVSFDLPDLKHYAFADDPAFPLAEFTRNPQKALGLCLDKLAPAPGALVFIDPVSPLCVQGNPNDARAVALSMHAFRRVARERLITLLCLVHFHKPKEDDKSMRGIDQIAGSGAFSGYSDVQMYLQHEQPGSGYQIFGWNPIAAPAEDFQLKRNEQGLFELYTGESELDELLEPTIGRAGQVYDLIPEDTIVPTRELEVMVFVTLHLSRATLFRILRKLEAAGLIVRKHGSVTRRKPK